MKKTYFIFLLSITTTLSFSQSIEITYDEKVRTFPEDFRLGQGLELNTEFPALEEIDIKGNQVSSNDFKNKVYVINFWFAGCRGCRLEEDTLKSITAHFENNENVEFLSFCMSSKNRIERYFNKHGEYGYKTVSISNKEGKEKFKVITSPTHWVVKNGIIVEKFSGAIYSSKVKNWTIDRIERLVATL